MLACAKQHTQQRNDTFTILPDNTETTPTHTAATAKQPTNRSLAKTRHNQRINPEPYGAAISAPKHSSSASSFPIHRNQSKPTAHHAWHRCQRTRPHWNTSSEDPATDRMAIRRLPADGSCHVEACRHVDGNRAWEHALETCAHAAKASFDTIK